MDRAGGERVRRHDDEPEQDREHQILAAQAERFRVGVFADGRWVRPARLAPPDQVRRLLASEHVIARLRDEHGTGHTD